MAAAMINHAVFQAWIFSTAFLYLATIFVSWFAISRSLGGVFIGIITASLVQFLLYDFIIGLLAGVV